MKDLQKSAFQDMRSLVLSACLIIILLLCEFSYANERGRISQQNFIYTPEEMLRFDIEAFLKSEAPHLASYSEAISHWSGRSSISPKIIISLLEHQSKVLSQRASPLQLDSALSKLSAKIGLTAQIEDVSIQLAKHYYKNLDDNIPDPESVALDRILESNNLLSEQQQDVDSENSFSNTFFRLFPDQRNSNLSQGTKEIASKTLPPNNLFQLPYPIGQSWQTWGGTHSFTGTNSGPRASLDFRLNRDPFGSDTSNIWVSSASNGQVIKHSSCFVEVVGSNGWSTNYYHLDNVSVNSGQGVSNNQRLANYANNLAQSLCGGGKSNGPHVHFSLKLNGVYHPLDGVALSGYTVHSGRTDYDSNCNFFWLDNNGSKICAGAPARNNGVVVTRPDLAVGAFNAEVNSLKTDRTVTASATVNNIGDASSAATQLSFLWSTDAGISFGDTLMTSSSIEALGASESAIRSTEFLASFEPGKYWVGACVIAVQGETNTANNCSTGFPITLEEKAKIVMPPVLLLLENKNSD